jgi:hypothetical protein
VATYAAIAATSQAIKSLLEAAASGDPEFATTSFSISNSGNLQVSPGDGTVTLYLYHIAVDASLRNSPGRIDAFGVQHSPSLPLDLHYLLTAWAKDAVTQQRLLGWACRVIADTPTLPASVLNAQAPDIVFRPEESVDLIWETITLQDTFDIWDVAPTNQQPSAAYVARIVEIESAIQPEQGALVQASDFEYGMVPT